MHINTRFSDTPLGDLLIGKLISQFGNYQSEWVLKNIFAQDFLIVSEIFIFLKNPKIYNLIMDFKMKRLDFTKPIIRLDFRWYNGTYDTIENLKYLYDHYCEGNEFSYRLIILEALKITYQHKSITLKAALQECGNIKLDGDLKSAICLHVAYNINSFAETTYTTGCPICYNVYDGEKVTCILIGCGHTVCNSCSPQITKCPICRDCIEDHKNQVHLNYSEIKVLKLSS